MAGKFTLISSKKVLQSRVFTVYDEQWHAPDGGAFQRHTVRHPGAVAVVPFDRDGNILLIRQFRPAANEWLFEIPAGTLEKGEPPLACAKRELIEEVGVAAKKWKKLGAIFLAPGYSSELIHLFKAWEMSPAYGDQDEDEHIEKPVAFSAAKIKKAIASGKICDAKTLSALMLCGICV
ncbi:MAG TPA: NUDIX hydrolase [Planctomycetota bacterium]|nr:NUDIX hydrolase [Planctomycetota bacterium]